MNFSAKLNKVLFENDEFEDWEDEFAKAMFPVRWRVATDFAEELNFNNIKPKWPRTSWDTSYKGEYQMAGYHIYYNPHVLSGTGAWQIGEPLAWDDDYEDRVPEGFQ